jgi:hypothetical protein
MKAYIITTGLVFSLITLAHFGRIYLEGMRVVQEPIFVITTILSISLCVWAAYLFKQRHDLSK